LKIYTDKISAVKKIFAR